MNVQWLEQILMQKMMTAPGIIRSYAQPFVEADDKTFTKINGEGFDLKVFFWCTDAFKCEEAKSEIMLLLHDQMRAENINMN